MVPSAGVACFGMRAVSLQVHFPAHTPLLACMWVGSVCSSPFLVAVDREKRSVVVAIRGTMSMEDAVTDGLAGAQWTAAESLAVISSCCGWLVPRSRSPTALPLECTELHATRSKGRQRPIPQSYLSVAVTSQWLLA